MNATEWLDRHFRRRNRFDARVRKEERVVLAYVEDTGKLPPEPSDEETRRQFSYGALPRAARDEILDDALVGDGPLEVHPDQETLI